MAYHEPQFLRISDRSSSLVEIIDLDDARRPIERLRHETQSPGGYWRLEFDLPVTPSQYFSWSRADSEGRLLYELEIEASGHRTIWQGRVEQFELIDRGIMRVVARGDWSKFDDSVSDDNTYTKNYNTTGDAIITDMVNNGFHADTAKPTLGTLDSPGITIDQTYPDEWSLWQVLTDRRRGVLSYPNSSDQIMDLLIYDDGVTYSARNPSAITWRAYVDRQIGSMDEVGLRIPWKQVANAVNVIHSGGTFEPTGSMLVNQGSIDLYGRRERTIGDIGTSGAATANARADAELSLFGDPQQQLESFRVRRVWDANNVEQPLCHVRAGDVIYVSDLYPNSGDLGSATLDAARKFYIAESICEHDAGVLRIRPDRNENSLRSVFALNRLRSHTQ
jgi:hypothetical protein